MAGKGPPKTPLATLRRQGSNLVKRREEMGNIEDAAVEFAAGRPPVSPIVQGDALDLWDMLVPILDEMGLLTLLDGQVIERYCVLYGRWRELEKIIRAEGHTFTTYEGTGDEKRVKSVRARPEARMAAELSTQLRALEREIGLSPAARTSIVAGVFGKREVRAPTGKTAEATVIDAKQDLLA